MKHSKSIKKGCIYLTLAAFSFFSCTARPVSRSDSKEMTAGDQKVQIVEVNGAGAAIGTKKIRIALLLDTSGSMAGLIEQAKSQLWKIVNELSKAKSGDDRPELEIALYEYGNDGLAATDGWIRQVLPLTSDLDKVSQELFSLTTNGGSEFCGQVIRDAGNQLNWGNADTDLQEIFIAGNEEFTQGTVSYIKSCLSAKNKGIFVNTIHCGSCEEGIRTKWKDGADLTGGSYMCIEMNRKTFYIESPYDKEIVKLNDKLNGTFIPYGPEGMAGMANVTMQDGNAAYYGSTNMSTRVSVKTSKVYSNGRWDAVDASRDKNFKVEKIKEADLPREMQGKTKEEKEKMIAEKKAERESIAKQVAELSKKRDEYVAIKQKEMGQADDKSLDAAMLKAIREQAQKKGFSFE